MDKSINKLWLSIGLAFVLIIASAVFTEMLNAGNSGSPLLRSLSPLTLMALVFGSFSFLSFVEVIRLECLSHEWKGATLQLIISALLAIGFGTDSGWGAGIGLGIIGVMLILPIKAFTKGHEKEVDDN